MIVNSRSVVHLVGGDPHQRTSVGAAIDASSSPAALATNLEPLTGGVANTDNSVDEGKYYKAWFQFTPTQRKAIKAGTATFDCAAGIKAAVDKAIADGYAGAEFAPGTWPLKGTRGGAYNALTYVRSDVIIKGHRTKTIFKIDDNYTAGGDYAMMAPETSLEVINNFKIVGITFDGNGSNNLVTGGKLYNIGAIRGAYGLRVLRGDRITVEDCEFLNIPGRNAVNMGWLDDPPQLSNVKIRQNRFHNFGSGLDGNGGTGVFPNHLQDDGSCCYVHADGAEITGNIFTQPAIVPPTYLYPENSVTNLMTCNAFEIHGRNQLVQGNWATGYTGGLLIPAQVHDNYNIVVRGNHFLNCSRHALIFYSGGGFTLSKLNIEGNVFQVYAGFTAGPTAIVYQMRGATDNTIIQGLRLHRNILYSDQLAAKTHTWSGMDLSDLADFEITGNLLFNVQATGINLNDLLAHASAVGGISRGKITDNVIWNCGLHTAATSVWGIQSKLTLTGRKVVDVEIDRNIIGRPITAGVTLVGAMRGIDIQAGVQQDIIIGPFNRFHNLLRTQRVTFTTTTSHQNVYRVPRTRAYAKGTVPVSGHWEIGDLIHNTDAAKGDSVYRYVATAGSFSLATAWTATTAYTAGQWMHNAASTKFFVALTDGTSGSVEPTATNLYADQVVDGTVTWVYVDTAQAALVSFAPLELTGTATFNPGAVTNGTSGTLAVTVTGAAAGTHAVRGVKFPSPSNLGGWQFTAVITATNTVTLTYRNDSGGTVTPTSQTITVLVA